MKKIYNRLKIEDYYNLLLKYYSSGSFQTTSNQSHIYNNIMLRFMIDNSNELNMYYGRMFVFRKNFYEQINAENPVKNNEMPIGDYLKIKFIESLKKFIHKNNAKLNILIEKYTNNEFEDLIAPNLFKEGIDKGVIKIKKLDLNRIQTNLISYFSFTDKRILYLESNKTQSAIYAFGLDDETYNRFNENFKVMDKISSSVS